MHSGTITTFTISFFFSPRTSARSLVFDNIVFSLSEKYMVQLMLPALCYKCFFIKANSESPQGISRSVLTRTANAICPMFLSMVDCFKHKQILHRYGRFPQIILTLKEKIKTEKGSLSCVSCMPVA